jgi:hypothetical protein
MPDLPTLTVTDAQAKRLLAAFGGVPQYKAWLRQRLVEVVQQYERVTVSAAVQAYQDSLLEQISSDVLPAVEVPVVVPEQTQATKPEVPE